MKAAIYARKSTDDDDKSDDLKSVEIQISSARRFAEKQGWTVLDEHIYVDDNVSGARISRPALDTMRAAMGIKDGKRPRRAPDASLLPFEVLIVRDQSRLIRNSDHTTLFIKQIIRSGVQLWYYKERHQVTLGFAQELTIGLQGQIDSARRVEASQDAREGLSGRAQKGYNTGGCCFGYDNKPVWGTMASGQVKREYTDFVINDVQADVIRRIYRMFADGYGHMTIAKCLNGDPRYANLLRIYFDGIRPEKPVVGKRGSGSWAPSAVWEMLRNERYRGVLTFGRMKNEYDEDGEHYRSKQADQEKIVRKERPELAIIAPDLWAAVQARIAGAKKKYLHDTKGRLWGSPGAGVESKYLLSGFGECGCCGRNITMLGGRFYRSGNRPPELWYGCSFHKNRGRTICDNGFKARMEEADALVISHVQEALTPDRVDYIIERTLRKRAERLSEPADLFEGLEEQMQKERRQRDNFLDLIAEGKAPASMVARIAALDSSIAEKEQRLAERADAVHARAPLEIELRRSRKRMIEKIGEFEELLHAAVPIARQALRQLIDGRIEFQPQQRDGGKFYRLRWSMPIQPLIFQGEIGGASPRGADKYLSSLAVPVECELRAA